MVSKRAEKIRVHKSKFWKYAWHCLGDRNSVVTGAGDRWGEMSLHLSIHLPKNPSGS